MANTAQSFELVFLTYQDVKQAHPSWTDKAIEDYLSLRRNLEFLADETDGTISDETGHDPYTVAFINRLQAQVGSGNALTSDETGFTVDSTKLSADMTEA